MVDKLAFLPFSLNFMPLRFDNTFSMSMVISPFGKNLMPISCFDPSLTVFGTVLEKAFKDLTAFSMGIEKIPNSDVYFLVYRDAQYTQITEIKTITLGSKEEVSNIKKALVELMGDSSSESITVQLKEEEKIIFKRVEAMGIVNINGYIFVRGISDIYGITGYLTKKRLEKLFPSEIFN
jgi:hypothetical protein